MHRRRRGDEDILQNYQDVIDFLLMGTLLAVSDRDGKCLSRVVPRPRKICVVISLTKHFVVPLFLIYWPKSPCAIYSIAICIACGSSYQPKRDTNKSGR